MKYWFHDSVKEMYHHSTGYLLCVAWDITSYRSQVCCGSHKKDLRAAICLTAVACSCLNQKGMHGMMTAFELSASGTFSIQSLSIIV